VVPSLAVAGYKTDIPVQHQNYFLAMFGEHTHMTVNKLYSRKKHQGKNMPA